MLTVLVGTLVYAVDPLQFYREDTTYGHPLTNARFVNPGLARNHSYEIVMVGTSLVENFLPSDMERYLGKKSFNLALPGNSGLELAEMIRLLLRLEKADRIVVCLDIVHLRGEVDRLNYGPGTFPFYLYDQKIFNDFQYLLNYDNIRASVRAVLGRLAGWQSEMPDMERFRFWGDRFEFSRRKVAAAWDEPSEAFKDLGGMTLAALNANFDVNILPLLRTEQVRFDLFFPPYSLAAWEWLGSEVVEAFLGFREHVAEAVVGMTNVRLHDFQADEDVVGDMDFYMDLTHYKPSINVRILKAIADGSMESGPEEVRVSSKRIRELIEAFDPQKELGVEPRQ